MPVVRRSLHASALLVGFACVTLSSASAQTTTFGFEAVVTERTGAVPIAVPLGTEVSGEFTFDPTAGPTFSGAPYGMDVEVGALAFSRDSTSPYLDFDVVDNAVCGGFCGADFLVGDSMRINTIGLDGGALTDLSALIQLVDETATAFSGTALPSTPPPLTSFPDQRAFLLANDNCFTTICEGPPPPGGYWRITALLTRWHEAPSDLEACETDLMDTEMDLGTCMDDLGDTEMDLGTCMDDLGFATADDDGDGIPDTSADVCPNTPPGAPTDALGCSPAEFCARFDVGTGAGRAACNNADWKADEPGGNPQDCRARANGCEPR